MNSRTGLVMASHRFTTASGDVALHDAVFPKRPEVQNKITVCPPVMLAHPLNYTK